LRYEVLKTVAKSELDGVIFTFAMDFDNDQWIDYIESLVELFENNGGTVYFVELETDLAERLVRNKSENRLLHKPSKRNIEQSEAGLRYMARNMRMNTYEGEQLHGNWLKVTNTDIPAEK